MQILWVKQDPVELLTSITAFIQWASVFADDATMAIKALDRVLHRRAGVNIRGDSYCLRENRESGTASSAQESARR